MKLEVNNLVKKYDENTVLDDISVKVEDFQVLALLGASGSGKSTLLRLIAGLEDFDGGELKVNDSKVDSKTVKEYRKKIGFVFQNHNLFNHLSLVENICLVLEKVHRKKRDDILPGIEKLLKRFDLYEHKDKLPHQLSEDVGSSSNITSGCIDIALTIEAL